MTRRFQAPGRVNLIGEHTDYSGGLVLPAAIDRCVTLDAEPANGLIVLESDRVRGRVETPADGSSPPDDGWGRYVAAVAAELAALGRSPVGLRGHLRSDLPDGTGLSSSAALEVVLATALCAVAGLELSPLELAAAAQRAELRAVGVPCGIMDQAASILGRRDHAVLLDCGTLAYRRVPLPSDLAMVVLDSGVSRTLEGSGYGQRRAELEDALEALDGRAPSDVDPAELDGLTRRLGDVPARRLRHVVNENDRVRRAHDALTAEGGPDRSALSRLLAASHASLRDDFEVSTPELDLLVELAVDAGAIGARLTGGGFGGAVLALADTDRAPDLAHEVGEAYQRRMPERRATVLVCKTADGAREVDGFLA